MTVSTIQLYEALSEKLGREQAKILTDYVEHKIEETLAEKKDTIVAEIQTKIAESKVELIKWMVALILGLFIALVGSLTAIIKIIDH